MTDLVCSRRQLILFRADARQICLDSHGPAVELLLFQHRTVNVILCPTDDTSDGLTLACWSMPHLPWYANVTNFFTTSLLFDNFVHSLRSSRGRSYYETFQILIRRPVAFLFSFRMLWRAAGGPLNAEGLHFFKNLANDAFQLTVTVTLSRPFCFNGFLFLSSDMVAVRGTVPSVTDIEGIVT